MVQPQSFEVSRKLLFDVFSVLMTIDIEDRDDLWERSVDEIKRLLNEEICESC